MREPARSFQDLIVWQKAHQFVLNIYIFTRKFPKEEIYSLTSQFRRSAVSIPANIAEGFKKKRQGGQGSLLKYSSRVIRRVSLLLNPD